MSIFEQYAKPSILRWPQANFTLIYWVVALYDDKEKSELSIFKQSAKASIHWWPHSSKFYIDIESWHCNMKSKNQGCRYLNKVRRQRLKHQPSWWCYLSNDLIEWQRKLSIHRANTPIPWWPQPHKLLRYQNFKNIPAKATISYCRSLKKVKFPTDQFRPALGSCCRLIVTMLKKPQNCPISDFFDLYPNTFCPYCLIQT